MISESVNKDFCPVRIPRLHLSRIQRFPLESFQYVFRVLSKTRLGHAIMSANKPLDYSSIRRYFTSNFKDIVPIVASFSTHSLRTGGPSAAAKCRGSG